MRVKYERTWGTAASLVGSMGVAVYSGAIGLAELFPTGLGPRPGAHHEWSATVWALAIVTSIIVGGVAAKFVGKARGQVTIPWGLAAGVGAFTFTIGQFWIKNHPIVRLARSTEGLGLEFQVLFRAVAIASIAGLTASLILVLLRRPATRAVTLCVFALGLIMAGHGHWGPTESRRILASYSNPPPRPLNVMLVTLDTQRADHLGCYGADVQTPELDRLAMEGTLFERAYSTTNVTMPSHATMLTSRWMHEHGLESNFSTPLSDEHITLPEVLSRVGYRTGAFTSLFIFERKYCGLLQGIDTAWAPERGFKPSVEAFTRAGDWIEENTDAPFFVWVHSYDVHRPYEPEAPYDTLYYSGIPDDPANLSFARIPSIHPRPFGVTDIDYYPAMYKGETTYQDHQLGKLFHRMRQAGVMDRTLIIVTADHGESLGEHDVYYTHDALYEEDVRVPLILRAPEVVKAGKRIDALVQTIDILPTVLDLLGLAPLPNTSGSSLVGLLNGDVESVRERVFMEGQSYRALAITDGDWSFIHPLKNMLPNHNHELFRISEDPRQETNLYYRHPEVVERLEEAAAEFLGRPLRQGRPRSIPKTVRQELEALGYIE